MPPTSAPEPEPVHDDIPTLDPLAEPHLTSLPTPPLSSREPDWTTAESAAFPDPHHITTHDDADDEEEQRKPSLWSRWMGTSTAKKKPGPVAAPATPTPASSTGVKTFRILAYAVLAFALVTGVKNMILPPPIPTPEEVTSVVSEALGKNGYPEAAAQAVMTQFLDYYLNSDSGSSELRREKIATLAPGMPEVTRSLPDGVSTITRGPVIISRDVIDDTQSVYSVAVKVKIGSRAPSWWYLKMPIYGTPDGAAAISGSPVLLPPPRLATPEGFGDPTTTDDPERTPIEELIKVFMPAWAGTRTTLPQYITTYATPATVDGLHEAAAVTADDVSIVVSPAPVDVATLVARDGSPLLDQREAMVTATWNFDGMQWTQTYSLTLDEAIPGKWLVSDIKEFSPMAGAPTDPTTGEPLN